MKNEQECSQARIAFETRGHCASLVLETPDVTVIDWRAADGSGDYYVRYILSRANSRQNLLIMGDLGSATFEFWWNPKDFSIKEFASRTPDANIEYFLGKLEASTDKWHYDYADAENKLRRAMSEVNAEYDTSDIEESISEAMSDFDASTGFGSKAYEAIEPYFDDLWEWFFDCGKKIHPRFYLWIVGLIMACRQIQKS